MSARPLASVSLDLDNLWSYMRVHNDPGWERHPTYLPSVVPLFLDLLDELRLKITVFVVGVDTEREENTPHLAAIARRGHELANHSYSHPSWLQRLSSAELRDEVLRAHDAIIGISGRQPLGFRGPGFSWTPELFELLAQNGYIYDASTFPTYLNPLARAYYFWKSDLSAEEKAERGDLFGSFRDGLRPLKPYQWRLQSERTLLEIPVTTLPVLKTPFHQSYLLFLAQYSERLMLAYLRSALLSCRLAGLQPSFLLHPTDVFGRDLVPELSFFPGMNLSTARKIGLLRKVLRVLADHFDLVSMGTHAGSLLTQEALPRQSLSRPVPVGVS